MNKNKVELIRSIADGDAMMFNLDDVNVDAYRSRCGELNKADGWTVRFRPHALINNHEIQLIYYL